MKTFLNLKQQAQDAIVFLNDHPGISYGELFTRNIYFSIQDVCKRGYDRIVKDMGVDIWASSKYASKFKAEFEKEAKKLEETYKNYPKDKDVYKAEKRLLRINVPYEKVFGEPWKYDRTEYWGEMSFVIYHGKPKDWAKSMHDWQGYDADINESALTFEELVIKMTERFKERFGDFESEDFLTKAEKQNHKKHYMFSHKKLKDSSLTRLDRNPKYIEVTPGMLNKRWAKWLLKTPYGKENWDSKELRKILNQK